MLLFPNYKVFWYFMTQTTADFGLFDFLMCFRTISTDNHLILKKREYLFYISTQNHVWAVISNDNIRNWAGGTIFWLPFFWLIWFINQPAFLNLPATVVITIEVRAVSTVWRFHLLFWSFYNFKSILFSC